MTNPTFAETLDMSLMTTLGRGSDSSDLAETHLIGRDRWRRIHEQARRIAQTRSHLDGGLTPIPALPAALCEPRPARIAFSVSQKRTPRQIAWLRLALVVIVVDCVIVTATVLARYGVF